MSVMRPRWAVMHALVLGPLREHPGRLVLTVFAIALGVALGVAVHLINASAVNEFRIAARDLAGQADVLVRGSKAGFNETIYSDVARMRGVAAANPALELDVQLAGRRDSIRILAFDPLRAAQVQPALLPERNSLVAELLEDDAVWLSPEAAHWLELKIGDEVALTVGTAAHRFRVAGLLPHDAYRQRLAVMDIATAQWRLARLGQLNRIDVKLASGTNIEAFKRELRDRLPAGVQVITPDDEAQRSGEVSRAYRTNLDMLALVSLFTGAFLIFSTQALALLRRRTQLALMRALGVTRAALVTYLLAEAFVVGAAGAACGLALGYAVAHYALATLGADLGAGYFRTIAASVELSTAALLAFLTIGIAIAIVGAALPAWDVAQRPPARALRAGDEEDPASVRLKPRDAALILLAIPSAFIPPVNGLPIGGYAAVTLVLIGSVLVLPTLAMRTLGLLPVPFRMPAAVAIAQIRGTPRQAAISIAAIVISVSLMVSMLIMVTSFRQSLDAWLERMLPADLYLRAGAGGETGFLSPEEQSMIAGTPGVRRVDFLRSHSVLLDPVRAPVTLLARAISPENAESILPLSGPSVTPPTGEYPIWVSEVAAELHGIRAGDRIALPVGGTSRVYFVAGIWRDYARQNGAIVLAREHYIELTGDRLANDAWLWLEDATTASVVRSAIRARLAESAGMEMSSMQEVRAASLALFDRTFAVTYALEAAAILVGLLGVSMSFSAQAIARRREFGVLRHLGMTRRQIAAMLAAEGTVVTALGAAFGAATGWILSLILIHVINRQSFHWTMDFHLPGYAVAAIVLFIVTLAAATAAWSGRGAMKDEAVRAVHEDW
jgi:putative ABC transport system permease protein